MSVEYIKQAILNLTSEEFEEVKYYFNGSREDIDIIYGAYFVGDYKYEFRLTSFLDLIIVQSGEQRLKVCIAEDLKGLVETTVISKYENVLEELLIRIVKENLNDEIAKLEFHKAPHTGLQTLLNAYYLREEAEERGYGPAEDSSLNNV